jgi:hypothetical protein
LKIPSGVAKLTLELVNKAAQAWAEIEYKHTVYHETGCAPANRFIQAPDAFRQSPSSESFGRIFRLETTRSQRRSNSMILVEAVRFKIPTRYRHFGEVTIHYTHGDLDRINLIGGCSRTVRAPIYPLDESVNANSHRAPTESASTAGWQPEEPQQTLSELPPS